MLFIQAAVVLAELSSYRYRRATIHMQSMRIRGGMRQGLLIEEVRDCAPELNETDIEGKNDHLFRVSDVNRSLLRFDHLAIFGERCNNALI